MDELKERVYRNNIMRTRIAARQELYLQQYAAVRVEASITATSEGKFRPEDSLVRELESKPSQSIRDSPFRVDPADPVHGYPGFLPARLYHPVVHGAEGSATIESGVTQHFAGKAGPSAVNVVYVSRGFSYVFTARADNPAAAAPRIPARRYDTVAATATAQSDRHMDAASGVHPPGIKSGRRSSVTFAEVQNYVYDLPRLPASEPVSGAGSVASSAAAGGGGRLKSTASVLTSIATMRHGKGGRRGSAATQGGGSRRGSSASSLSMASHQQRQHAIRSAGTLIGGYQPPAIPEPLDPAAPRRPWPLRGYPTPLASRSYQRLFLNPSPAVLTTFETDSRYSGAAASMRDALLAHREGLAGKPVSATSGLSIEQPATASAASNAKNFLKRVVFPVDSTLGVSERLYSLVRRRGCAITYSRLLMESDFLLDVARIAVPYQEAVMRLFRRRSYQRSLEIGTLGGGEESLADAVTGQSGQVRAGLDPCIVSASGGDGVVPQAAWVRLARAHDGHALDPKSAYQMQYSLEWWKEAARESMDTTGSTGEPGELLCACGCGARWGEYSSLPAHRGADVDFSARLRALSESGRTHAALLDPAYDIGQGAQAADIRGWRLSPNIVPGVAAGLARTDVKSLVLGEQQGRMQTEKSLLQLVQGLTSVEHLRLEGCQAVTETTSSLMGRIPHAQGIVTLDLKNCLNVTDDVVANLVVACPRLYSLRLEGCNRVTDRSMHTLVRHSTRLHTLDVSWCPNVTHRGLVAVMIESTAMVRLSCRGLGRGYQVLSDGTGASVAVPSVARHVKLHEGQTKKRQGKKFRSRRGSMGSKAADYSRRGSVAGGASRRGSVAGGASKRGSLTLGALGLDDEQNAQEEILKECSHSSARVGTAGIEGSRGMGFKPLERLPSTDLVVLSPSGKREASTLGPGAGMAPIYSTSIGSYGVEVQSLLEEVDLSFAAGVSDEVMVSLFRNNPGLRMVRVAHGHRLTAATTTAIALFCPGLQEMRFEFCDGICSPLFNLEIAGELAKQTGLLLDGPVVPQREQDAPAGTRVGKLARKAQARAIKAKVMEHSTSKDYPEGRPPAKPRTDVERRSRRLDHLRPLWTGLRVANLTGCVGLLDGDAVSLVKDCEELYELRVSGCARLTGSFAMALRLTRANFRVFHGAHLRELDDDGLSTICETCPGIEELDVTGCTKITDKGLVRAADALPALQRLRASHCSYGVTMGGVLYVASQCRLLRILEVGLAPTAGTQSPNTVAEGGRRASLAGLTAAALKRPSMVHSRRDSAVSSLVLDEYYEKLGFKQEKSVIEYRHESKESVGSSPGRGNVRCKKSKDSLALTRSEALEQQCVFGYYVDLTFRGDMGSFLAAIGLCLPLLRELDVSGRTPAPPVDPTDDLDKCQAKRYASMSDLPRSLDGVDRMDGITEPTLDVQYMPPLHEALSFGEDNGGKTINKSAEATFPFLARLSVRGCGNLGPKQLTAVLAMAPNLLSLDVTGCYGISMQHLVVATGGRKGVEVVAMAKGQTIKGELFATTTYPETQLPGPDAQSQRRMPAPGSMGGSEPDGNPAAPMWLVYSQLREVAATDEPSCKVGTEGSCDGSNRMTGRTPLSKLEEHGHPAAGKSVCGTVLSDSASGGYSEANGRERSENSGTAWGSDQETLDIVEGLDQLPAPSFSALGFYPVPGACVARESAAITQQLAQETIAANRMRGLILHGLRKQKRLVYTITWRIEVKRRARLDRAARIVVQAMRMMAEFLRWQADDKSRVLQLWWRKCLFLLRCERRVRSAVEARREAQIKRLAAAMMLSTSHLSFKRVGFERLRLAALLGRWEDDRHIKRQMGIVPRYDVRGRIKVQVLLPEDGPQIIPHPDDEDHVPMGGALAHRPPTSPHGGCPADLQLVVQEARTRLKEQAQTEPADFWKHGDPATGDPSDYHRPARELSTRQAIAANVRERMLEASKQLMPTSPSSLIKGPDGRFCASDDEQAKLWVEGGTAATLGVRSALQREMAYRRQAHRAYLAMEKAKSVAKEAAQAGPKGRYVRPQSAGSSQAGSRAASRAGSRPGSSPSFRLPVLGGISPLIGGDDGASWDNEANVSIFAKMKSTCAIQVEEIDPIILELGGRKYQKSRLQTRQDRLLELIDPVMAPEGPFNPSKFQVTADDIKFYRPSSRQAAVPGAAGSGAFKADRPGSRGAQAPRLRFATERYGAVVVSSSNPYAVYPSRMQAFLTRPESKASAMRALRYIEQEEARKRKNSSLRALLGEEAAAEYEAEERARQEEAHRQTVRGGVALIKTRAGVLSYERNEPRRFKPRIYKYRQEQSAVGEFLLATGLSASRSNRTSMLFPLGRTDHTIVRMHQELYPRSLASTFKRGLGRALQRLFVKRELKEADEILHIALYHMRRRRGMVRKIERAYRAHRMLSIAARNRETVSHAKEEARLERYMNSVNANFMHKGGHTAHGMESWAILRTQSMARMRYAVSTVCMLKMHAALDRAQTALETSRKRIDAILDPLELLFEATSVLYLVHGLSVDVEKLYMRKNAKSLLRLRKRARSAASRGASETTISYTRRIPSAGGTSADLEESWSILDTDSVVKCLHSIRDEAADTYQRLVGGHTEGLDSLRRMVRSAMDAQEERVFNLRTLPLGDGQTSSSLGQIVTLARVGSSMGLDVGEDSPSSGAGSSPDDARLTQNRTGYNSMGLQKGNTGTIRRVSSGIKREVDLLSSLEHLGASPGETQEYIAGKMSFGEILEFSWNRQTRCELLGIIGALDGFIQMVGRAEAVVTEELTMELDDAMERERAKAAALGVARRGCQRSAAVMQAMLSQLSPSSDAEPEYQRLRLLFRLEILNLHTEAMAEQETSDQAVAATLLLLKNYAVNALRDPIIEQGRLVEAFMRRAVQGIADAATAVHEARGAVDQSAAKLNEVRLHIAQAKRTRIESAKAAGEDPGAMSKRVDPELIQAYLKHGYMSELAVEADRALGRALSIGRTVSQRSQMEGKRLLYAAERVRGFMKLMLLQAADGRRLSFEHARVRMELEAELFRRANAEVIRRVRSSYPRGHPAPLSLLDMVAASMLQGNGHKGNKVQVPRYPRTPAGIELGRVMTTVVEEDVASKLSQIGKGRESVGIVDSSAADRSNAKAIRDGAPRALDGDSVLESDDGGDDWDRTSTKSSLDSAGRRRRYASRSNARRKQLYRDHQKGQVVARAAEGAYARATLLSKEEQQLAAHLRRQKEADSEMARQASRRQSLRKLVIDRGCTVISIKKQPLRVQTRLRSRSRSTSPSPGPASGGSLVGRRRRGPRDRHSRDGAGGPLRFRPATAGITPRNTAYYSATGDGEDIGNPGYWYEPQRKQGVVYGLLGVRMDFGVLYYRALLRHRPIPWFGGSRVRVPIRPVSAGPVPRSIVLHAYVSQGTKQRESGVQIAPLEVMRATSGEIDVKATLQMARASSSRGLRRGVRFRHGPSSATGFPQDSSPKLSEVLSPLSSNRRSMSFVAMSKRPYTSPAAARGMGGFDIATLGATEASEESARDPELESDDEDPGSNDEAEQGLKEDLEEKRTYEQMMLEKRRADRYAAAERRRLKAERQRYNRLARIASFRQMPTGKEAPKGLAGRPLTYAERKEARRLRKRHRQFERSRGLEGVPEQRVDQLVLVRKKVIPRRPRPPPMPLRGLPESHDAYIQDDRDWDLEGLFGYNSRLARQFGGAGGAAAQEGISALDRARQMFELSYREQAASDLELKLRGKSRGEAEGRQEQLLRADAKKKQGPGLSIMDKFAKDDEAARAEASYRLGERRRLQRLLDPKNDIDDETAARQFPMDTFPGYWEAHVDDDKMTGFGSGRTFFFHVASRTSHWHRPTWGMHRAMEMLALKHSGRKSKLREKEVGGGEIALKKFEEAREKRRAERVSEKRRDLVRRGMAKPSQYRITMGSFKQEATTDSQHEAYVDTPHEDLVVDNYTDEEEGEEVTEEGQLAALAAERARVEEEAHLRRVRELELRWMKKEAPKGMKMAAALPSFGGNEVRLAHAMAVADRGGDFAKGDQLRRKVLLLQAIADAEDEPSFWRRVGMRDELLMEFAGIAGGVLCAGTSSEYERRLRGQLQRLAELRVRAKTRASRAYSYAEKTTRIIGIEIKRPFLVSLPASVMDSRRYTPPGTREADAKDTHGAGLLQKGTTSKQVKAAELRSSLLGAMEGNSDNGRGPMELDPLYTGGRDEAQQQVQLSNDKPYARQPQDQGITGLNAPGENSGRGRRRQSYALVPFIGGEVRPATATDPMEAEEIQLAAAAADQGADTEHPVDPSQFLYWRLDGQGRVDDELLLEDAAACRTAYSRSGAAVPWAADGTFVDLAGFRRALDPTPKPWMFKIRQVVEAAKGAGAGASSGAGAVADSGSVGDDDEDEVVAYGITEVVFTAGLAQCASMAVRQSLVAERDPMAALVPVAGTGQAAGLSRAASRASRRRGESTTVPDEQLGIRDIMTRASSRVEVLSRYGGSAADKHRAGGSNSAAPDPTSDPLVAWVRLAPSPDVAVSFARVGPNPRGCFTEVERQSALKLARGGTRYATHPRAMRLKALWTSPDVPHDVVKRLQAEAEGRTRDQSGMETATLGSTEEEKLLARGVSSGGRPIRGLRFVEAGVYARGHENTDDFSDYGFRRVRGDLRVKGRPRLQVWVSFDAGCPDLPRTRRAIREATRRWERSLLGAAFEEARVQLLMRSASSDLAVLGEAKSLRRQCKAMHTRLLELHGASASAESGGGVLTAYARNEAEQARQFIGMPEAALEPLARRYRTLDTDLDGGVTLREALLAAGVAPRPTVVEAMAALDASMGSAARPGGVGMGFGPFMRTVGTFCVLPARALLQLLLLVIAPRLRARVRRGSRRSIGGTTGPFADWALFASASRRPEWLLSLGARDAYQRLQAQREAAETDPEARRALLRSRGRSRGGEGPTGSSDSRARSAGDLSWEQEPPVPLADVAALARSLHLPSEPGAQEVLALLQEMVDAHAAAAGAGGALEGGDGPSLGAQSLSFVRVCKLMAARPAVLEPVFSAQRRLREALGGLGWWAERQDAFYALHEATEAARAEKEERADEDLGALLSS